MPAKMADEPSLPVIYVLRGYRPDLLPTPSDAEQFAADGQRNRLLGLVVDKKCAHDAPRCEGLCRIFGIVSAV